MNAPTDRSRILSRRTLAAYAAAIAAPFAATLLKANVDWLGHDPDALYLATVMIASWLGGLRPGLVATAASCLFAAYLFLPPHYSFAISAGEDIARLFITAAEGSIIAYLAGQLLDSKERLRRTMLERIRAADELRRATEQLRHANKLSAVGQLAGGVAHDVNNMVSVVMACAELLERRLPADHAARAETREIRGAAERAASLSKQFLAFARRAPATREPFDVNDVVAGLETLLQRATGSAVRLSVERRASRARVVGSAKLFEQVLVNLAINARDAMPNGGRLEVATNDAIGPNGTPHVELVVRDSGIGMDEETRRRASEPFFTTKPEGAGTGLGLSVAFGVVESMGGEMTIDSAPQQGTTMRLLLPLADGEAQSATG